MTHYNNIKLEYKNEARKNYMSLSDLLQDLTTDSIIKILPTLNSLKCQMSVMKELDNRNDIKEDYYFELLETCNGL